VLENSSIEEFEISLDVSIFIVGFEVDRIEPVVNGLLQLNNIKQV